MAKDLRNHTGKRAALAAELKDQSRGWQLRGNDKLSMEAAEGAAQLRSGADEVTVGHLTYRVTEDT